MKFNKWLKTIATMLAITIILTVIPLSNVYAQSAPETISISDEQNVPDPEIVYEETRLREESVKYFRMSDGSYTAAQYGVPVHYRDESGVYRDIDNTLQIKQFMGKSYFQNRDSSLNVMLPQKLDSSSPVVFDNGNGQVSWLLHTDSSSNVAAPESSVARNAAVASSDVSPTKVNTDTLQLPSLADSLTYESVMEHVDINYTLTSNKLKESIIIERNNGKYTYAFTLNTGNNTAVLQADNSVHILKPDGTFLYRIETPYLEDNLGVEEYGIEVLLVRKANEYIYTLNLPKEWMDDETRAYPVILDPTITAETGAVLDTTYCNLPAASGSTELSSTDLKIGTYNSAELAAVVKSALPSELLKNQRIVSATLTLKSKGHLQAIANVGALYISACSAETSWQTGTSEPNIIYSDSTPSFNLPNGVSSDFAVYNPQVDYCQLNFDITRCVQSWLTGGSENHGIVLRPMTDILGEELSGTAYISIYSSEADVDSRPVFKYVYRDASGLENYWTYSTQSAGDFFSFAVNNFNLDYTLIANHPTLAVAANKMPVTISSYYSRSNYDVNTYGMGYGFKTNFHMFVDSVPPTGSTNNAAYYFTDSDWTKHYFYSDDENPTEYIDEDGLGYTLKINSTSTDGYYEITDKSDNAMLFDQTGRFRKLRDLNGNEINVAWVGTSRRIDYITDGAGRKYSFTYNSSNMVSKISSPRGSEDFYYNNAGYLAGFPLTGSSFTYTTTASGKTLLTKANNAYIGEFVELSLSSISELPTTLKAKRGPTYLFELGIGSTTITTSDSKSYIYQFNRFGQTVNVVNNTLGTDFLAQNFEYGAPGGATGSENKVTFESKTIAHVGNLIYNPTFASRSGSSVMHYLDETASNVSAQFDSNVIRSAAGSYKFSATSAASADSWVSQLVGIGALIPAGTYTASIYLKTDSSSYTGTARLKAEATYENATSISVTSTSEPADSQYLGNNWERITTTITTTAPATIKVFFGVNAGFIGNIWFADLAFEEGDAANYFNLLENSDFSRGSVSWTRSSGATIDSEDGVVNIEGSHLESNFARQLLDISLKKGEILFLGGWGESGFAAASGGKNYLIDPTTFRIRLELQQISQPQYINGELVNPGGEVLISKEIILDFNDRTTLPQFVSRQIIADNDYNHAIFSFEYDQNLANAKFYKGFIYKESFGTSYSYDKNGNVVSTKDLAKSESSFSYSDDSLNRIMNPTGSHYFYEYDENKNLVSANSSSGIHYDMTYDEYGNATSSTVTSNKPDSVLTNNKEYYIISAGSGFYLGVDSTGRAINAELRSQNYNMLKWEVTVISATTGEITLTAVGDSNNYTLHHSNVPSTQLRAFGLNSSYPYYMLKATTRNDGSFTLSTAQSTSYNIDTRYFDTDGTPIAPTANTTVTLAAADPTDNQGWYFVPCASSNNKKMTSSITYSEDDPTTTTINEAGEFIEETTDNFGNSSTFTYNSTTGLLASETNPTGTYNYTYSGLDLITKVQKGYGSVNYTYYADRLATITSLSDVRYSFAYDNKYRNTTTSIGSTVIGTNEYVSTESNLVSKFTYGNNAYKNYYYDPLDRLTSFSYNGRETARYSYDKTGALASVTDLASGLFTKYGYDMAGRKLKSVSFKNGNMVARSKFVYQDGKNRLSSAQYVVNGIYDKTYKYIYGNGSVGQIPDLIYKVDLGNLTSINYSYDDFGRLSGKNILRGTDSITYFNATSTYTYAPGYGVNSTSERISSMTDPDGTLAYTYDSAGNITSIRKTNSLNDSYITYSYDDMQQLVGYNNGTDTYSYYYSGKSVPDPDGPGAVSVSTGNITSIVKNGETVRTFYYAGGATMDHLTAVNGTTLSYDAIGNPTFYYNGNKTYQMTWSNGRQLTRLYAGTYLYNIAYDADGNRTSKIYASQSNGSKTTNYHYCDGLLVGETTGSNTITFTYDETGSIIGFTLNGVPYYYLKNIQGDVTAIIDNVGTIVGRYTYDPWGNIESITGNYNMPNPGANSPVMLNPIRYRSYYYDSDIGFYYLGSRYYDPAICRFINADSYVSTGQGMLSNNMYAYCENNPIMFSDPTGSISILAIVIISIGAIVGGVLGFNSKNNILKTATNNTKNNQNNAQKTTTSKNKTSTIKTPPHTIDQNISPPNLQSQHNINAYVQNNTPTETELTVGERIQNTVIGAAIGVIVAGGVVAASAAFACVTLGTAVTSTTFLGATWIETFSIGALAFNLPGMVLMPIIGVEHEPIELPK